ncbi:MAG TPA: HD domain-containing protein [Candidatus Nitrosopolaris sp.]|nr:HD domain-containing protein [Candidatus Nitrosopolaris sp.]
MGRKKRMNLNPFFQYVLRLKQLKRAGWISRAQISNPESVADHSYSACAISMALSDMLGLNTERVMKMAILHDLPESIIGDFVPGEVSKKRKRVEENNAIETILQSIPPRLRSDYKGIWSEYLLNKTDSARLVHVVDKLEMALQAKQYVSEGCPEHLLAQFLDLPKKYMLDYKHEIISQIQNALKPRLSK